MRSELFIALVLVAGMLIAYLMHIIINKEVQPSNVRYSIKNGSCVVVSEEEESEIFLSKEECEKAVKTRRTVECYTDDDCVPASCCHATECIPKNKMPVCEGIFCTTECVPGTLDCGQGKCQCVENKCIAVFN